jgi:hypothetical protein
VVSGKEVLQAPPLSSRAQSRPTEGSGRSRGISFLSPAAMHEIPRLRPEALTRPPTSLEMTKKAPEWEAVGRRTPGSETLRA